MTQRRLAGTMAAIFLVACVPPAFSDDPPLPASSDVEMPADATILRVFLTEGTSLVSYGEPARVGDRVVFSVPTSASMSDPHLHLVNIPASQVDWPKTERYAEAARTARYLAGQAEHDYQAITDDIAQTLYEISNTDDPRERLRVVENARKRLAEWPPRHFNYKQAEVARMLGMLDEAIAELRAAIGADEFDLSFVALAEPPKPSEVLLPLPTPKEAIELVLTAARLSDSSTERVSLMTAVVAAIDRDLPRLPDDWARRTRASTRAVIARELDLDRQYHSLTARMISQATARSRLADVRGVERLMSQAKTRDRQLGARRPDAMASLMASIETHLEAARQLRLTQDRWALRQPDYRKYSVAISRPFEELRRLKPSLEDIKAMSGSSPVALGSIETATAQVVRALTVIVPPEEFRAAHALFVSAVHMADRAARMRREAALSGDMAQAWDASSAAAGALMLEARARSEIQALFRPPQLPR